VYDFWYDKPRRGGASALRPLRGVHYALAAPIRIVGRAASPTAAGLRAQTAGERQDDVCEDLRSPARQRWRLEGQFAGRVR
jgi:hypothetical protein